MSMGDFEADIVDALPLRLSSSLLFYAVCSHGECLMVVDMSVAVILCDGLKGRSCAVSHPM